MDTSATALLTEVGRITRGAIYKYIAASPKNCYGETYKVLDFVIAVPAYQQLVLVKALTGPDKGLKFCCTPANFVLRYAPNE